ncbi:MAG: AbrB/MazE/SpoVT family DNA-binding domain-containing protein [Acidobacteria bacterium]|nr:MAG: AbrB/MazE/SpoVT family DNA-binding domain-containing protein [Acidobacteriota bacterium]
MATTPVHSRVTSQNQTSVPAEVRKELGIQAGTTLEWNLRDGEAIVRRARKSSFEDIHKALFPEGPPKRQTLKQLKQGIADYIRENAERRGY